MGSLQSLTQICMSVFYLTRGEAGKARKMSKMWAKSSTSVWIFMQKCCPFYTQYYLNTFTLSRNCLYHPLPTDCMHSTHAHPQTPRRTLACRQSIPVSRAKCPVLGRPSGLHANGILVREQENMLLFQRLPGLFVIFSKVTRDCGD